MYWSTNPEGEPRCSALLYSRSQVIAAIVLRCDRSLKSTGRRVAEDESLWDWCKLDTSWMNGVLYYQEILVHSFLIIVIV
jgi:hypothetical protein